MLSVFSKLKAMQLPLPTSAMPVLSPLEGMLQLPDTSTESAVQSGLLGEQLQILLQGNQLIAPFHGQFERADNSGRRLRFVHSNGLKLYLEFAEHCCNTCEGFRFLTAEHSNVQAGQVVAQLDVAKLQRHGPASCLLSIQPHPSIRHILYHGGHVSAGATAFCWLEFQSSPQA